MSETEGKINSFTDDAFELLSVVYNQPTVNQLLSEMRSKDQETYFHSIRIGFASAEFATSGLLGLDQRQSESLVTGGLLHDLGKVSLSNESLYKDKSDPLTEEEWVNFRAHPMRGYLRFVAEPELNPRDGLLVLAHHLYQENGYPNITKGFLDLMDVPDSDLMADDVAKSGLAIAVADKLDAMHPANKGGIRAYRKRAYRVDELPGEIWDDFEAAGVVRKLGMSGLLANLLGYSQTTFLRPN